MPLRYVFDEHLRGPLWSAVERQNAEPEFPLDAVRVGDMPELPLGTPDPHLLVWAESAGRILVTLDKSTMPEHFREHLAAGHHSPGVMVILPNASIGAVFRFLLYAAHASEPSEWLDLLYYIP
jgi:hypothetical protein